MAVMDEFKEEREALKNGNFIQKLSYFWYYYKWYVIITIAVILLLVSFIHSLVSQKEDAFYGVFLNSWAQEGSDAYLQGFADKLGVDTDKYDVMVDSSLYMSTTSIDQTTVATSQKIMVYTAASELDVMVTDIDTIAQYANNETFSDLRELLSPEQIAAYEPYFYYIDQKPSAEEEEIFEPDEANVIHYPDPTKPEEMDNPVPVGIYVDSCKNFIDSYAFLKDSVVLGVIVNTERPDAALAFIDYVFEQG